jgi:hypothetical protein
MGLPQEEHGGYSGADASYPLDPDEATADEMLDGNQDQGSLDFHNQANNNKRPRSVYGDQ